MRHEKGFPKPVKLRGTTLLRWRRSDIERYLAKQVATSAIALPPRKGRAA
jgi:predicted DNA-binding transcriptional regulator AlpA